MTRKHNTKHPERGLSNYPKRKARRSGHDGMENLRTLRKLQLRGEKANQKLSNEEYEALVNEGLPRYSS
jgi:hypothetical protein